MKFSSLVFLMGIVALLSGAPVSGQVTRVVERGALFSDLTTTDAMGNLLVTGDLLAAASSDPPFAISTNDVLSDDANGITPGPADGVDSEAVTAASQLGGASSFTYTFPGPVEITRIDVYSAWLDARAGQNLEISLSTNGVDFVSLINYNEESTGGEVVLSSITDDAGVPLGSDVTAIRFTPAAGEINGDGAVLREIDVIGTGVSVAVDRVVSSVERAALFSDLSTTDAMGNLLVTGDLLTTASTDPAFPISTNDVLSDDANGITPGPADGVDSDAVTAMSQLGDELSFTYTLASPSEITQIDVYSAWLDARAGQNLEISLSTNGVDFVSLINYNVESTGGEVVLSTITRADGSPLGTGITAIRFTPAAGEINGDGGVYREFDVIGTGSEVPVLLGDVNLDGSVNFLDISPFIGVLSVSGDQAEADLNQDGAVNFLDITPFIVALSNGGA